MEILHELRVRNQEVRKMIEKQVITVWYTPDKKLPQDGLIVVVTINGKSNGITYDHSLALGEYYTNDGWYVDGVASMHDVEVLAWADLEPYKGGTK